MTEPRGPTTSGEASLSFVRFELEDGALLSLVDGVAAGGLELLAQVDVRRAEPLDGPLNANVLVDGVLIHKETVAPRVEGSFKHDFRKRIVTDELDPTTATPKYLNGSHEFKGELVNEAGEIIGTVTQQVRFQNRDRLQLSLSYPLQRQATDLEGRVWNAGDVAVDLRGVFFTPGVRATGGEIKLTEALGGVTFGSSEQGGFTRVVLEASRQPPDGIGGLTLKPGDAKATLVTSGAPLTADLGIRVDNEGPQLGEARLNLPRFGWLGADDELEDLYKKEDQIGDSGIGAVVVQAFYRERGAGGEFQLLRDIELLRATATNDFYEIRADAVDGLGNRRALPGTGSVGRDLERPTIVVDPTTPVHGSVISGPSSFRVLVSDVGSGVPQINPVFGTLERAAPALAIADECVFGRVVGEVNESCAPVRLASFTDVPDLPGFWTFNARGLDVARNLSQESVTRTALRDGVAPNVQLDVGPVATPSGKTRLTFTATDNVSVRVANVYQRAPYGAGTISLPTTPPLTLSEWGTALGSRQVEYEAFPITAVQLLNAANAPFTTPAPTLNYILEAVDHARLAKVADAAAAALPAGADARTRGVQSMTLPSQTAEVCNGNPAAPPCPAGRSEHILIETRVVTVASAGSTTPPFKETYAWVRDPVAGRFYFAGTSTQATVSQVANGFQWLWQIPVLGTEFRAQQQATLLVGGRTEDGLLLMANPTTIRIIDGS